MNKSVKVRKIVNSEGWGFKNSDKALFDFVIGAGSEYKSSVCPADILRGKIGDCFDVCLLNAMMNKKYRYVEGFARNPMKVNEWILHAWLTDGKHVFDPTWVAMKDQKEFGIPTIYVGIEMDTHLVAKLVLKTQYRSVLANGWRNRKLASEILKVKL